MVTIFSPSLQRPYIHISTERYSRSWKTDNDRQPKGHCPLQHTQNNPSHIDLPQQEKKKKENFSFYSVTGQCCSPSYKQIQVFKNHEPKKTSTIYESTTTNDSFLCVTSSTAC